MVPTTRRPRLTACGIIRARYKAAIAITVRLIDQTNSGQAGDPALATRLFSKLKSLFQRLGLATYGYPWETLAAGCEQLICNGEYLAARSDLARMVKHMRRVLISLSTSS